MRKKLTMLFASLFLVLGTAWAQTPVLKLTGEQINETGYPYALTDEDAAKVFGLTDLTIAVKVNTPASLSGRCALFCTSDPTKDANTSAMATNSHYVAYGTSVDANGAHSSYLASCINGDKYSDGTVPVNTEDVVLVYVLNTTANNYKAYINGAEVMDRNFGSYEIATPKMVKEDYANAKIYIGGGVKANNAAFETFNGTITGVEVYDGVLDDGQVKGVFPVEFAPEAGKMYALKENTTGFYVDIQTLGIHESGYTTNSMSLNNNPCIIYFEAGNGGKWKMKNINGTYAGNFTSGRHWNTTISSTAYEWTITAKDGDLDQLTIAKDASNYIGWDNNKDITAGSALYNNAEGGNKNAARLYFTLVEYTSADLNPQGYYSLKLKDENNTFYLNFTESGDTKATLQSTPTYFHILPSANKNYLIFQNKDNASQYLGHPAGKWATTYDCKLWQVSEADEDGLVLISRHAGDGGDGGNNFGTNESIEEGKRLYTNVKGNCKKWLIEGVFDCLTNGTVKNGNYEFKSAPIRYLNACNKIRFTLTESGAFFQNGAKRMSLDEFVLYDAKGKKVELTAKNVTGNNNKTYEGMFDGVNDNFAGTATWNDGTEDDYFEVLLPKGIDLGGAFSFSFVTENTTMNSKAFKIETSYQKINSIVYTFVVDAPKGHSANATYNGGEIADDQTFEEDDFDVELFAADEISGYTWKVVVDDESATITLVYTQAPIVTNPEAVVALVNRIGGAGIAEKFQFVLDPSINSKQETFILGNDEGKILIKGSTLSAITTGLGWYLNNIAHINIAWNSLNEKTVSGVAYADLSNLPLPSQTETHTSDAKYRYYLNYCTFGYSMTSWTWKRWQQEIDWMALHGINMPLQIVGLEEVWRKFLTMKDANGNSKYNYSDSEAKAFVAGPAFTAWWGMNNLEGWGGTSADGWGGVQDDAWYKRQVKLAKQITDLQRALGMQPVLPGFSGMVPTNFTEKTNVYTDVNGGKWCGFQRPRIIDPTDARFAEIAADYYDCLEEVMGESQYYSMDPFHEGGSISSGKYTEAYKAVYDAMEATKPGSQWVIQQWQWNDNQKKSIAAVPAGRLIVLDLFSDGSPAFDSYKGYAPQDGVFCAIPNFGGRSGLMGRLQNVTDNYFKFKAEYPTTLKGIGTAPEAIEQTPVTYDLIYQLPWMNGVKPDVAAWVDNYAYARYGKDNAVVKEAWSLLRQGPLNYGADAIQGPVEDVWAAIPNLNANPASAWGKTLNTAGSTYTPARRQMLIDAVYKLIDQEDELALENGSVYESNYLYDLVEFGGAVMADYAYDLLLGIKAAKAAAENAQKDFATDATYIARRDAFLALIEDVDAFKGTNLNFRLGKWTQEARDAAAEVENATSATPDWYEFNNARTILTTWGDQAQSVGGYQAMLRDYSYRSWQGLMKDVYLPRWQHYFDNNCTTSSNYFFFSWNWAHGMVHNPTDNAKSNERLAEGATGYSYTRDPENKNTVEKAVEMLGKYIIPVKYNDGTTYYAYRTFNTDLTGKVTITVPAGATVDFTQFFDVPVDATVTGDFLNDAEPAAIIAVPVISTEGETYIGTITLTDGTKLQNFTVKVKEGLLLAGYYHINWKKSETESLPMFIGHNTESDEGNAAGYKMLAEGQYSTDAAADKVFALIPQGDGFVISAQGKYLQSPNFNAWNHVMFSDKADEAGEYLFTAKDGAYTIKDLGELPNAWSPNYLQIYGVDDKYIIGNDVSENAHPFTLTPVTKYTLTIPASGITALCLPFNVVLPEEVEAYDITKEVSAETLDADENLELIAAGGSVLKAGTPAILKGAEGNYQLGITMSNKGAKTSLDGSILHGTFATQVVTPTQGYKALVYDGDEWIEETKIPANTCWIELEAEEENEEVFNGYYYIYYKGQPVFVHNHMASGNVWPWYSAGDKMIAYTDGVEIAESEKIFLITPSEDGNGYTLSVQGKYMGVTALTTTQDREHWDHIIFSADETSAGKYKFERVKEGVYQLYCLNSNDSDYAYVGSFGGNPEIFGNNTKENAADFSFVPMTSYSVVVPEEGYTTLYLPFNVVLPQGVEAYDIDDLSKEALADNNIFEKIAGEGQTLAAGTAVIIKAVGGEYQFELTADDANAVTSLANSVLQGTYVKQTFRATADIKKFVLRGDTFDAITGLTEIPANSCWIEANIEDDDIELVHKYITISTGCKEKYWIFRVKKTGNGLTIVDCEQEGDSPKLQIGESYRYHYVVNNMTKESAEELDIIAISDQLLKGNKFITEVHFPKTLTSVGTGYANYMFEMHYWGEDNGYGDNVGYPEGDKDESDASKEAEAWIGMPHACQYKMLGKSTWRMTIQVTKSADAEFFNGYGSCLFATKEKTLSNNYNDGSMQLYLRKRDNGIAFKLNSTGDTHVFNENNKYGLGDSFNLTFVLVNDGSGGYKAKMTYDDNTIEEFEITADEKAELRDFYDIWSSLGSGIDVKVKFEKLTNQGLFVDCVNLTKFVVDKDNPSFLSCEHGVLYNKLKTHVIRFPEDGGHSHDHDEEEGTEGSGEQSNRHFEVPYTVTMVYAGALHGVDADIVFHSNPLIMHVEGHDDHMKAKYYLKLEDDSDPDKNNYAVDFVSANKNTYESARYLRAPLKEGQFATITLPFTPEAEVLERYTFYKFDGGDVEAKCLDFSQIPTSEVEANTPYLYRLRDGVEPSEDSIAFETKKPVTIKYKEHHVPFNEAGSYKAEGTFINHYVETAQFPKSGYYYLSASTGMFHRVTEKLNYRPYRAFFVVTPKEGQAAQAPARFEMRIGPTTEIDSSQVEVHKEVIYYDLMGRRVLNPANGIYIVNGKKVVL